ncbi:hypothetical protein [Microbacterium sp. 77mftsu3.1]|uniref:hypothetical protein n=1 Tax=Microbacterium sp. 77mftsu3.1 TaxID=1761802 RepID=UPI0003A6928C|nr:hypothetical protein [Microbacterium sp. 77mftsu3.1]SDH47581.1 hypothetical protein SAMN04488590_3386 [Microbacterium sp. 77mftsu3.1]
MDRGFAYDRLTAASDERVEAVRDKLYAAPCGMGTWVSVNDGTIVRGNGGNEREQWHWQKLGPWILLDETKVAHSYLGEPARELQRVSQKLDALRSSLRDLVEGEE